MRLVADNGETVQIYLSLGSNIEPDVNLSQCIDTLSRWLDGLRVAPVYRSAAVGFEGPDFLNTVVEGQTRLSVNTLSTRLQAIEDAQGRDRSLPRFSSRPLDLDLLLYGTLVHDDDGLRLPRPEIRDQAFVLQPMADLAPQLAHPESGETMESLLEQLKQRDPDSVRALSQLSPKIDRRPRRQPGL